jgi:diguanylate cyclase (GGDEF)-like protein
MLYLTHASRNILERVAAWGSPLPDSTVFKPDDCWALRRGRMHIVEENSNPTTLPIEHNHSLICPHITISGPADYLCVPLVAQGEALGLLHLRHLITPGQEKNNAKEWYDHLKRSRIHTIVDSLSLALANLILRSSLRQQSIRDPLTGMFNRRYLEETLDREILRAGRNQQTVGVIMLDIDHFKLFNDTYGHQAGDAMLTALGHFFSTHVRGEDIACRYGGEEFILLMPGASLEITKQRAEELLEKVRFVNVTFQGQSLRTITLSMGISIFPQNGSNGEALVQRADQALYRAKAAGRDQVVVA